MQLEGCITFHDTPTGFAPELLRLVPNSARSKYNAEHHPGKPTFLLRPEYVESLFYLHRITGDVRYQDLGWAFFQSLQKHCWTPHGYAGLSNVFDAAGGELLDSQPSYFLGETLKYLLLLFSPELLPVTDYVFTTEAHPLRRQSGPGCAACLGIQQQEHTLDPGPTITLFMLSVLFLLGVIVLVACRQVRACFTFLPCCAIFAPYSSCAMVRRTLLRKEKS